MKKVMLVIVCLLFAATAFAQQSDPSNDVGYVKLTIPTSGVQDVQAVLPFGLPFKFWTVVANVPSYGTESTRPSSIVGAQTNPGNFSTPNAGDRVVRQSGGQSAFRTLAAGNPWSGTLESTAAMLPGFAYTYQNKSPVVRTLVLAGDVDNSGGYGTVTITAAPAASSATSLSFRDSRNRTWATNVGPAMTAQGFRGGTLSTSDLLVEQISGNSGRVTADLLTFGGSLTTVQPGKAHTVQNRVHVNGAWVYNFDTGVAAAMHDGLVLPTPAVTKVPMGKENVKTSSVKTGTVKTVSAAK